MTSATSSCPLAEARRVYARRWDRSLGTWRNGGELIWLVVEPYPSEKYEFVSWDDDIPNRWKNKTCSKPPTRNN